MVTLKFKEIKKMSKEERNRKLKELNLELVKARASASKGGSTKIKETKKIIARIKTINASDKEVLNKK